eukprot:COSAG02_NODE_3752_length_6284_cov_8.897171_3_plen_142_part_00
MEHDGNTFLCNWHDPVARLPSSLGQDGVAVVGGEASVLALASETGCGTQEELLALSAQALAGLGTEAQASMQALKQHQPCRRKVRGTRICTCGRGCKCMFCGEALPTSDARKCKSCPPTPPTPSPLGPNASGTRPQHTLRT